jgi:cyanophycinase-like exopeptidase
MYHLTLTLIHFLRRERRPRQLNLLLSLPSTVGLALEENSALDAPCY